MPDVLFCTDENKQDEHWGVINEYPHTKLCDSALSKAIGDRPAWDGFFAKGHGKDFQKEFIDVIKKKNRTGRSHVWFRWLNVQLL